ncbi:MAG: hypothetical protein ACRDSE_11095 [Pseudonocardiaceae bacterium]
MDDRGLPSRLHTLLLALAGRLDDSALRVSRELIARSRLDEAAELVTGTLIAGRMPVLLAEKRELAHVLELSRSDAGLAERVVVAERDVEPAHRFIGADEPGRGVAEALERVLRVLPDVRSVHAVRRATPAGGVPGPVPQLVVLVEVGSEGSPPATAYRVDAALRQAGIPATVEVAAPGIEWPPYQRQALAAAVPVWRTQDRPAAPAPTREPIRVAPPESAPPPKWPERPVEQQEEAPEPEPVEEPQVAVLSEIHPRWWEFADEPDPPGAEATVIAEPVEPPMDRTERTADMSTEEVEQLKAALAETGESAAAEEDEGQGGFAEPPEGDGPTSVPQLSDRDRSMLARLHAELAKREQAEQAQANGSGWVQERPRWSAG